MIVAARAVIVAAALFAVPGSAPVAVAGDGDEDARFAAFLERLYEQRLERSPMLAASLGEHRTNAGWDDISDAGLDRAAAETRDALESLREEFEPEDLSPRNRVQHRVLEDELELLLEIDRWRDHAYPLNQIVGLHLTVPGTLTGGAPFAGAADAEAHIARIRAVETLFSQLVTRMEKRATKGMTMPQSLYPRLLEGARGVIRGAPFDDGPDNPVWSDFTARLDALELDPAQSRRLRKEARAALLGEYRDAYRELIETLEAHAKRARFAGGVWQLPDGEEYYDFLLRQFTTTDMTAEEVHALGLREVERIHGEMRGIMARTGFEGELQEFFVFMKTGPRFYAEDSDAGRATVLSLARELVADIGGRVEDIVYRAPSAALEVRRFEAYREKSAPGAFYEPGAADGTRPAVFYLNLADMSSVPLYGLNALVYHETIPGHHLQISAIFADPGIPALRKLNLWWLNSAFVEGWALYAEKLAHELGYYRDPYADYGRLSAELWRACRLVVDTGLHARRWSRERAIAYLDANTSSGREANLRAVDRYIAVPAQATSFKVGMNRILAARERARAKLGDAFDIRGFHQAVLEHGYVPLSVMEESVDAWARSVAR